MNYSTRYISLPERFGRAVVVALWVVFYLALYGCDAPDDRKETTVAAQKARVQVRTAVAQEREPRPSTPTVTNGPPETPIVGEGDGEVGDVTFDDADAAFKDRRYPDAVNLFDRYVRQHSSNPWGHYMLGLSHWKAGSLEEAEQAFERTLELDPSHLKSLLNLSRVLLDGDRPTEALEQVDAALDIEPQSGDGLRLLGRALYALGDVSGAIDAYEEAVVIDESDAWSMNNLGLILIREERFDAALLPLARATQVRADVPVFLNNLGIALERTGHFEAARDAYQAVIELDDGYEKAMVSFARVEGRDDDPLAEVVDLTVLAERFVADLERRHRATVTTAFPEPVTVDTATIPIPVIEPGVSDSVTPDSTGVGEKTPVKANGTGGR